MRVRETPGSRTERRDLRRQVRNTLGTSRDDLPSPALVLVAAKHLDRMLHLATGGRLGLALIDRTRGEFVDYNETIRALREGSR